MRDLKDEHGIGYCNITKCCTEVCPEHITITDNGATVTVNYGTGSFTITNLADPAQLDASDFLF